MEFFNDNGVDPLKPSLFELVAQEQLKDLLQPALKYVLAVFAQRYPRYLLRIVNRHEEFYALIMLIVERHYLKKHNASFSENFYGLKRRRRPYIETERAVAAVGGIPAGEKLRGREIWRSLLFLVGVPYLKAKAYDYFEELGGTINSDLLEEGLDARQIQALTDQRSPQSLKGRLRRLFKRCYPYLNVSFELWLLLWNVGYLFEKTPNYRPWLNWVGVDIRRLGIEDFRAANAIQQSRVMSPPRSLSERLKKLLKSSPRILLDSLRLLLPTAIFFIKFLEWWYSPGSPARSLTISPQGPAIPPPSLLPPHPQGIPFDAKAYGMCPLCKQNINNATALPSGYVFCYRCAYDQVEKHGKCPVTLLPARFGKQIQAQQIPGWSSYYLDYKFLKKIISSLAANRPASEAAALALGITRRTPSASPAASPGQPLFFAASGHDLERGPDFQAHKAAFFFKLERELEKINSFYLQKEAEVLLRMETLLSKRRAAAMRGLPETSAENATLNHAEWSAVEEGFRLLERDLTKLQQFVEINATGFRKILKKFDKRSTSTTKELYLARQVDVQPVFNRQLISELSDTVATCLLNITDLSSGLKFEGPAANDIFTQQILTDVSLPSGPFRDLENNFHKALESGDKTALLDCVHYSDLLGQQSGGKSNVTRILWNIIIEAPPDMADLIITSLTPPFDFQFVDDINGRTCLHEASIAGARRMVSMCLENGVPVDKGDVYGRTAIHYAAMKGFSRVCEQLLEANASATVLDRDNYSPLVYATLKGDVESVRVLFEKGHVSLQLPSLQGDLNPLSLASQAGHVEVVAFLLQQGAVSFPNSNGEYPIHLAARAGHAEICKLLIRLEGWDTPDKYHEWTPLFHAARYGHAECVKVLLDSGCRASIRDELGHCASHYAAWYGHQKALSLLLSVISEPATLASPSNLLPTSFRSPPSETPLSVEFELDNIPSLSLPPPIMPHRVYGHNYLVNSHLVQVTIGRSLNKHKTGHGVRIHHRLISPFFKDGTMFTSTPLKLVMTAGPHVNAVPYSMSLPPTNDEGSFAFQVQSLEKLSLEFSIYPNFGTKTIGRAVALPSLFNNMSNNQSFRLPILDRRLHTIGEVDFDVNIITAFQNVTLEVGGELETYWKSKAVSNITVTPSTGRRLPRRPNHVGSVHASPMSQLGLPNSQNITISSIHGNYISVIVQVTRDLYPVVYSGWQLPDTGFDLGVSDVTLSQFENLAQSLGRGDCNLRNRSSFGEWNQCLSSAMVSLDRFLKELPLDINVALELAYPSESTRTEYSLKRVELNSFVDAVLQTIFRSSSQTEASHTRRNIIFTSFSPDICSSLNWKQPNYPVLLGAICGKETTKLPYSTALGSGLDDQRVTSIGAAVDFAKSNNLLGLFVDADILIQVPSITDGIRSAELLIGVYGSESDLSESTGNAPFSDATNSSFDFVIRDGTFSFLGHSIRDLL
ncbi:hypothetical protein CVT24_002018 [Panaeolus cyanescens]|uniref:Peroxisome assembly protein 12 n=1 Tax=Panaeolus cyanescens TaxID=181874 RepID=A0A409YHH4_9AGAR|nr:hypothetical protein CVT24_002018 [Panaeolus cyanescens]